MDFKELLNVKKQRNYLVVSSVVTLLLLLIFPVAGWGDFSAELTRTIGSAPSEKYHLFSEDVNNSFAVLLFAVLTCAVTLLNYSKTQNGEGISKTNKILYGIAAIGLLIFLSSMTGDPDYSVLEPTFAASLGAVLTIGGLISVFVYPFYLKKKQEGKNNG